MRSPQEQLARYEELIPHLHNTQVALWELVEADMMRSACRLMTHFTKCDFAPSDPDSLAMLLNYCCFNLFFAGGRTLTDLYVEGQTPRDEDHRLILEAHRRSFYSLFELVRIESGVGVWLRDLLNDAGLLLVYPRLAATMRPGLILPVRVMPVEDFHVLFNGPIPFQNVASVAQFEANLFATYGKHGVAKGRVLTAEQRGNIETFHTIYALAGRHPKLVPPHLRKAPASLPFPDPAVPAVPARRFGPAVPPPGTRVGRNDQCPCGSGKKFKQCCLGRN